MNNYQLYRTNLFLGGQMKWDIIVSNDRNTLYVSDFNISPISNNCTYNALTDVIINNNHQDNIKLYYSKNKGNFYSECIDANFSHNYPLILNADESANIYSNTFDMGCKRSKLYSKYKKQFEFLCPLWLERVDAPIKFKISILDDLNKLVLSTKILTLNILQNKVFHNKFVNYFNNYINYIGLNTGNDNVINIKFNKPTTISGLNAETGMVETKTIDELSKNIISRERPLIEVDNMLINAFKNNNILCKQLFNFNLCFNINDILTGTIGNMLIGRNVIISVDVYIGDKLLEKRDFYTEYDHINRYVSGDTSETYNVFDYLHDNEIVDLIDKNKFCQSICHWSLCDNNDYIFNVYNGFAGIILDKNDPTITYINNHQYANSPNLLAKNYNPSINSIGWINTVEINSWNDFYEKYILNIDEYKHDGVLVGDNVFINNVKYNYIGKLSDDNFYLLGIKCKSNVLYSITDIIKHDKTITCHTIINGELYILQIHDLVILLTNNYDNLSFGKFNDILHDCDANIDIIGELLKMFNSVIYPDIIKFNKTIVYNIDNTKMVDLTDITEKRYYKYDISDTNYVARYDGKIKPTFTTTVDGQIKSTLYYKDYVTNDNLAHSVYALYSSIGEPLYPSIDYCAIKKLKNCQYDTLPTVVVSGRNEKVNIYKNVYEYNWFNKSKCLILHSNFTNDVFVNTGDTIVFDDIINDMIANQYKISDIKLIAYIRSLYDYYIDKNYSSTNKYTYTISFELK